MVAHMNATAAIAQHIIPPPFAQGIVETIVRTIVAREQYAFRRSSHAQLRSVAAKHRTPRRQAVVVDGRRWDKETRLRVDGLDVHAFANDVRTDELESIDDRASAHVRRWEGVVVVRRAGVPCLRATWCGTNGAVDLITFDHDDETISDETLHDIQRAIADEFGCPEDMFGFERVTHEDLWQAHPPDARFVRT